MSVTGIRAPLLQTRGRFGCSGAQWGQTVTADPGGRDPRKSPEPRGVSPRACAPTSSKRTGAPCGSILWTLILSGGWNHGCLLLGVAELAAAQTGGHLMLESAGRRW